MRYFLFVLMPCLVLMTSCFDNESKKNETAENATVAGAIFDIPTSFTGETAASSSIARSVASDSNVSANVSGFYNLARDQIKMARSVSISIREILSVLESVTVETTPLFEYGSSLTWNELNGDKLKWTPSAGNTYMLEKWISTGSGTYLKVLELNLVRNAPHFSGSVILRAEGMDNGAANPAGVQQPRWIKVAFDNDSDGAGLQTLDITLQGFRFSADLAANTSENAVLNFTRNEAAEVTLSSLMYVPGSRHFVWDGYTNVSAGVDALNASAAAETRCYIVNGKATADNHATISLALPVAGYTAATVFNDYSLGKVICTMYADRLNNNYDFDGSTDNDYDQGHEIIGLLNLLNSGSSALQLDTTSYSNNTPDDIYAALAAAVSAIPDSNSGKVCIETLVGVMGVTNPAYFNGSVYAGNGTTPPAGYIAPAVVAAMTFPVEADVSGLTVVFSNATDSPGF